MVRTLDPIIPQERMFNDISPFFNSANLLSFLCFCYGNYYFFLFALHDFEVKIRFFLFHCNMSVTICNNFAYIV